MYKYYKYINGFLLFALTAGLAELYINAVYPVYEYYGYQNNFNLEEFFFSLFIFLLCLSCITLIPMSQFAYGISLVFFIFSLIPNLILYFYMDIPVMIIIGIALLIGFFIMLSKLNFSIPVKLLYAARTPNHLTILAIALTVPFLFVFGINISWESFLLSGTETATRLTARGIDNLYTGYVSNWLVNVICPTMLVLAFWKRKTWMLIVAVALMFYIFSCYGTKSVFLSVPLVIGLSFFEFKKKLVIFVFTITSSLLVMAYLLPNDGELNLFNGIFINRLFFVPALNSTFYFDFFEGQPLHLSSSVLKSIGEYPFSKPPSFIIGDTYYNQIGMSANNGLPGDGYMNFGNIGVIAYSFLIASVFAAFNSLKLNHRFFGIFIIVIFNFIMTAFTTVILTHGLILFYLLCLFMFRGSNNLYSRSKIVI